MINYLLLGIPTYGQTWTGAVIQLDSAGLSVSAEAATVEAGPITAGLEVAQIQVDADQISVDVGPGHQTTGLGVAYLQLAAWSANVPGPPTIAVGVASLHLIGRSLSGTLAADVSQTLVEIAYTAPGSPETARIEIAAWPAAIHRDTIIYASQADLTVRGLGLGQTTARLSQALVEIAYTAPGSPSTARLSVTAYSLAVSSDQWIEMAAADLEINGLAPWQTTADVSQALIEVGWIEDVSVMTSELLLEVGFIRSGRKYNVQHI